MMESCGIMPCSPNKPVSGEASGEILVIGDSDSKRVRFFKKAAGREGVRLSVTGWDEVFSCLSEHGGRGLITFLEEQSHGAAVKIEPPSSPFVDLGRMDAHVKQYRHILELFGECKVAFLNTPESLLRALDKRCAKRMLCEHGIATTQMLAGSPRSPEELLDMMKTNRVHSVFIKPVFFSGAAGVAAFRLNPGNGAMKLYTSCYLEEDRLVNTKRLRQTEDRDRIFSYLSRLLCMDVIVEKWYPKAAIHGLSYDLRAVYQFGRIAHIVVRTAKGPVTNLHLNNMAIRFDELAPTVGRAKFYEIEKLCGEAVSLFDGMQTAGIDVMLDKNSLKPRIIEINGQGDLIYQDIYEENKIYGQQVRHLTA